MTGVAVPETTTVFRMSAAVERFNQSNPAVAAVEPCHTTATLMFVVIGKSTVRKADPAVVIILFTTLHRLCAASTGYSVNGVDHHAVDHATIMLKVIYVATVILFQKCMVLHVVVSLAIIRPQKYVATASFYQNLLVRVVVVPGIMTLRKTFVALATYCRDHQVRLAVGQLIMINLNTFVAEIIFIQNHMALNAVPIGVKPVVQVAMESQ